MRRRHCRNRDGHLQPLRRLGTGDVGTEVVARLESPAPTVLRGTIGGGVASQLPDCVHQHRARGAQGGQHRADAAVHQLPRRSHHRLGIALGDRGLERLR